MGALPKIFSRLLSSSRASSLLRRLPFQPVGGRAVARFKERLYAGEEGVNTELLLSFFLAPSAKRAGKQCWRMRSAQGADHPLLAARILRRRFRLYRNSTGHRHVPTGPQQTAGLNTRNERRCGSSMPNVRRSATNSFLKSSRCRRTRLSV